MALTARFMVAAVAFNSPAAMPTTTTATKACSFGAAKFVDQLDAVRPPARTGTCRRQTTVRLWNFDAGKTHGRKIDTPWPRTESTTAVIARFVATSARCSTRK